MKISLSAFSCLEKLAVCLSEEILLVALPRYKYPREMVGIFRGAFEQIKKSNEIMGNLYHAKHDVSKLDIVKAIKERHGTDEEIKCLVIAYVVVMVRGIIFNMLEKAKATAIKDGNGVVRVQNVRDAIASSGACIV